MPSHTTASGLVLDAPEFFVDPEFLTWLATDHGHCSTCRDGVPAADAEVLVLVDPGLTGEGSASSMPEWCWAAVLAACKEAFGPQPGANHILVNIRNRVD